MTDEHQNRIPADQQSPLHGEHMRYITPAIVAVLTFASAQADDIQTLQAVGQFSKGSVEARAAQTSLVQGGQENLLPILQAFQGSTPLAANWLRSTFETIAAREVDTGRSLPADKLVEFVKTTSESPDARRLAYEWALKQDSTLAAQLIPKMLLDPSPEFRRDAVNRLLEQAAGQTGEPSIATYRKALSGAVHEDHVKTIAKALRDVGQEVNIPAHFGFVTTWQVVGPFDNKDMKGYSVPYAPETGLDLSDEYDGQLGKVKWKRVDTDDDYGLVNISKVFKNHKGSLMYATATFHSKRDRSAELRLGTPNAWKLWINGQLVFEREEYHRGTRMDQYRIPVSLKAGSNAILLKVCQNEQTESWAQKYQFQARICDSAGAAISPSVDTAAHSATQGALR